MFSSQHRRNGAFTIIEILVVIGVMVLLVAVVLGGALNFRAKGRNAKVLSDKENIKLALVRAREAGQYHRYPGYGATDWICLKSSGTCGPSSNYVISSTVNTALNHYMQTYPQPAGTKMGEIRHDAYLYYPYLSGDPVIPDGSYIMWAIESPITECPGTNLGELETGVYYCAEKLPT